MASGQISDNGKTIAIISYITPIGWIIAFIMNGNNKTSLAGFHIRQSLGIFLISLCVSLIRSVLIFIPFIGGLTGSILSIGLLILWILGLVSAAQGEQKPVPIVGDFLQKTFSNVGN